MKNTGIKLIPLSINYLVIHMKNSCMKPLICFGVNILISIIRLILLKVTNLSRVVNILVMVIVIYEIRNIIYHAPKS